MKVSSSRGIVARTGRFEKGAIEGLPLLLLILIVIAAVGLGILLVWMNQVDDQKVIKTMFLKRSKAELTATSSIRVEPATLEAEATHSTSMNVRVLDSNDDPIGGVAITCTGCGWERQGITWSNPDDVDRWGYYSDSAGLTLPPYTREGKVTITASKAGYSTFILEIPITRVNGEESAGHYGPGGDYIGQ